MKAEEIPLTQEVLEKFGFEGDDDGTATVYTLRGNANSPEITYCNGEYAWTINCYEYKIVPLKYVSQLEKVLSLCGLTFSTQLTTPSQQQTK